VSLELSFAVGLPPGVPEPPAAQAGGVRWPEGVYRASGERPDRGVRYEASDIGTERDKPPSPYPAESGAMALPAAFALGAAALALGPGVLRRGRHG
jgi:hypothetical protein